MDTEPSDMSFSLSIDAGKLEWASHDLGTIFAQRSNLGSPSFLRMIYDVVRFGQEAPKVRGHTPGPEAADAAVDGQDQRQRQQRPWKKLLGAEQQQAAHLAATPAAVTARQQSVGCAVMQPILQQYACRWCGRQHTPSRVTRDWHLWHRQWLLAPFNS